MSEALLELFRQSLPAELSSLLADHIANLESGNFLLLLQDDLALDVFGRRTETEVPNTNVNDFPAWNDYIFHRLGILLVDRKNGQTSAKDTAAYKQHLVFLIGYAALLAFLQSNVTGPPLPFSCAKTLFPDAISKNKADVSAIRRTLVDGLNIDGVAAYKLAPNLELLCLADAIMTCPPILKNIAAARWAKLRITFIHQRLLSEPSPTLEDQIYSDLDIVREAILDSPNAGVDAKVQLLLETATIDTFHGFDKRAKTALEESTLEQNFTFALTGLLGKRTKFQQHDISQLVVLAKSANSPAGATTSNGANGTESLSLPQSNTNTSSGPSNLDLNDETLLENISFTEKPKASTDVQEISSLPQALADLDPSNQPQLRPLDSIILLSLASSITNTSPADGLTREETLPYAVRVLEGGSSNWQIYTQALLVRSRMEGYKSRTIERGLLQLQTLVDQVIADTASSSEDITPGADAEKATSFLPRPTDTESAPASERLRYIFQLASPLRWELEAELAARWVQLGGLRSALEIYERLEMWAEAALCWAATEREEKAKRVVRKQLYHFTKGDQGEAKADADDDDDDPAKQGDEIVPPPPDAPRLYCILGDIDQDPTMYEKAWQVSGERYARAQRSLGRYWFTAKDYLKAAEAYAKGLKVAGLHHSSWFALGCSLLELAQFPKAVEAFSRCVQLDDHDAEAWSNLAAALLKQEPQASPEAEDLAPSADDEDRHSAVTKTPDPRKNRQDALKALKRAATLKHDSFRIWENVMLVAASTSPPDYASIVSAQKHIIDLRGPSIGERAVDVDIMTLLVRRVTTASDDAYDPRKPGFERLLVELFDTQIAPLITASRALWALVARLALWRGKAASALDAHEKAWRAVATQPGWEEAGGEARWNEVVDATVELCDAYESLGPRERTEGLGAGEGVLVAKDWRFKARSAVRSIMGRGKGSREDTEGWTRLRDAMDGLRN